MDKDTKDMCPNFTALNGRLPGGAKVGKAVLNVQEPTQKVLHCHTACSKYPADQPCSQPSTCENNRRDGVRCPLKEIGEHHDCDYEEEHTEGELVRINRTRVDQHQHQMHGCYWGMESLELVCVAPRDTVVTESIARQMSVTVKDNQMEEQENFNSTSEKMLDDDALYEQNDFEESDLESEADSETRSAASELESYNSLMQRLNPDSVAQGLASYNSLTQHFNPMTSRQFPPRRPVGSDTESDTDSTTNKSVKRPIATRQRIQQQTTPTKVVGKGEGREGKSQQDRPHQPPPQHTVKKATIRDSRANQT